MRALPWLLLVCVSTPAMAEQAPWARPDIAISDRDRVYCADQTSNTVSVIDPAENKLLGVIRLGDPVPGALSPLYKGQLLVHGMGYSPDSKTLAVVSVGSNSVTLIDTATNKVKGVVYVGRSPHAEQCRYARAERPICGRSEQTANHAGYSISFNHGRSRRWRHTQQFRRCSSILEPHLPGAESELIVNSDHGAQCNQQAIQKVDRILKANLSGENR